MILHYYRSAAGNFGDDLNVWLWPRLLPGCWDPQDGIYFAGIGTIIGTDMPSAKRWIVLSSGAGYGPAPPGFGGTGWRIISVRGPLSAEVLGLAPECAATDGAILLARLPEYSPLPISERDGTIFVPHHQALEGGHWAEVCKLAGVEFLSPTGSSHEVIQRIRRAKLVIADAMHAAIIADAMRVPWIPAATSLEINTFKWLDWTSSVEVPYEPTRLPPSSTDEALRSRLLALHGQRYFVTPASREAVLAHYRGAARRKRQFWWPGVQRFGERLYGSGVKHILRACSGGGIMVRSDQRRLEASALVMQSLAKGAGFLSSDVVWDRHLMRLTEQLGSVRAILDSDA